MAATNYRISNQIAASNLSEAKPLFTQIRKEDLRKNRLEQVIVASNATKIQQDREIERLKTLIDQENAYHERRINDLQQKLLKVMDNKHFLNQRLGWQENELWQVNNNKEILNEELMGMHSKQTRQNKLKAAAFSNILNFEKEARKKMRARTTSSRSKAKPSMKRNSY